MSNAHNRKNFRASVQGRQGIEMSMVFNCFLQTGLAFLLTLAISPVARYFTDHVKASLEKKIKARFPSNLISANS